MKVLITLGPTQEPIDSVRYITTGSSGKMGCALATEALKRGHAVTVVAGPVSIELPKDARIIPVRTAAEMTQKTLKELEKGFDLLISTAAIADYTPAKKTEGKIKSGRKDLKLELVPTLKLTNEARMRYPKLRIMAFKAEHAVSHLELIKCAGEKLAKENLDLIAANDIEKNACGSDANQVTILDRRGMLYRSAKESKEKIAERIWDIIEKEKK
ncbi:MAG: phosphopantothenoylcysteine decarboxylase [Candidatus Altiarchaeia archaeon]